MATRKNATQYAKSRPMLAFGLMVVGGILALLGSLLLPYIGVMPATFSGFYMSTGSIAMAMVAAVIVLVSGLAAYTTHLTRVHLWSIVALIFSIVGLSNTGNYSMVLIGFALGLVGGILGITYS